MPTKVKRSSRVKIDPLRLYTYEEIAEFCGTDVSARQVKRWVDEGKIGYTVLPNGRWRRISGKQYLDSLKAGVVEPEH